MDYRMLIDGKLVDGDLHMDVTNPATGEVFASCPRASADQLEAAISAAKRAFVSWSQTSIDERRAPLLKLADALAKRAPELSRLLTQEQGKPLHEAEAEISYTEIFIRRFAELAPAARLVQDDSTRHVEIRRRPLGVVAAIVPWNFPVLLISYKLPFALLAGNTIVVKPAPTTPLTALRFGELCADIFPPGVVNFITDQNDLGSRLASHPDVSKVAFTGSTSTGRKIMAGAAATLKRLTLELGGNDAAIVLSDADIKKTAKGIFNAAFMNCGQVCIAVKRVYVHDTIYDAFSAELAKLADAAVVDDGLAQGVEIGPLHNRDQYNKIVNLLEDTKRAGRILAGGVTDRRAGYFVRPTIVADIADGTRLVDEEQFGPILPIIRFHDAEDALRAANASVYGLGGSVWSKDEVAAKNLAARMEAGTVWINTHLDFGPDIPFCGAKQSGLGVEFGEEGLNEYSQIQVINTLR